MKVIKSEADIANLKFGESFSFEFPTFDDDPDGPVKTLETPEYKKSLELEEAVNAKFSSVGAPFTFEVTDTSVVVTVHHESALPLLIDGDAYKTTMNSVGEKSIRLQKKTEGFLTFNGEIVTYA